MRRFRPIGLTSHAEFAVAGAAEMGL